MITKKNLLFYYLVLAALPLWADVFRPDSSSWVVVELHDRDTITLDSAALYKFSQTADTIYNALVVCKSPHSFDTIIFSLDISELNVKDFQISIGVRCNAHLQGDAVFGGTCKVVPNGETTIDVDTLPEVWPGGCDVFIERGKIGQINGGRVYIGKNKAGDIHVHNIAPHNTQRVYLYDGIVSNVYLVGSNRLTMYGGYLKRMYWTGGTINDTILIVNSGEVAVIDKNGDQAAVINGGSVGLLDMGNNGHRGNVYLNGGVLRSTLGSGSIKWHNPNKGGSTPVDTLFLDQHAIVGYGHGGLEFKNKDGVLKLDDILSLTTIVGSAPLILLYENRALGARTLRTEPTAINGYRNYNMTIADSLLVWDFLSIYESQKRTIHYQVGEDGIAPKDTTYQEGIVRYFTSIPTRTDYDFMGWYADSLCTIRVDSLDEWSRGDTTLWARWELIPERLTYETFGIQLANQDDLRTRYSEQQQFSIPDAIPERPFYEFYGWHVDSLTGPIVTSTSDTPLVDMNRHILYGEFTRDIPSLSIMIAQGTCLAVRNPEGYSELASAYYTWVHQDTIFLYLVDSNMLDSIIVDSIISDTLSSHKMYVEVGKPIPTGRYSSIIQIDEEWPIYVTRYFPAKEPPSSNPRNSNTQTLFYIGSYILEVDEKGHKYIIMP